MPAKGNLGHIGNDERVDAFKPLELLDGLSQVFFFERFQIEGVIGFKYAVECLF